MLYSFDGRLFRKRAISLLVFFPTTVFAEVSDKEPSLFFVWAVGVVAAVICFVSACFRKWLALALAVLPLLWFISFFMDIHSADVGPFLYAEQGLSYYIQSCLSLILFISGTVLGLFMKK
ncbi:MAG TPA: hypothetical protein VN030_01915, partial [Cellvibrio sp.]|nr:hypothetical protein [Cellvibrio sp.]